MDTLKNILTEQKDAVILIVALLGVIYFSWGLLSPVFFEGTSESVVKTEAQQLLQNFSQTNQ